MNASQRRKAHRQMPVGATVTYTIAGQTSTGVIASRTKGMRHCTHSVRVKFPEYKTPVVRLTSRLTRV